MGTDNANTRQGGRAFFYSGLLLGVGYWVLDSVVMTFVLHESSFLEQLLSPSSDEIWERLFTLGLFTVFGSIAGGFIGQRRRAEDALRESEERFKAAFENAAIGMAMARQDGSFLQVNSSFCKLLGHSRQELLGMSWPAITHPEDLRTSEAHMRQLFSGEKSSFELEKRYVHKDGHVVRGRVAVSLVRDNQGRAMYDLAVIQDITERKRAERALRESEVRFRQMAENLREVFWLFDVERQELLYVNPAYEKVFGLPAKTLYEDQRSFQRIVHPEDVERVLTALKELEQGKEYQEEYRIVRPEGSVRWILDRGAVIQDNQGKVYRTVGIAQDITERKQAQIRLRQSEQQYRLLFESANDAIIIFEPQGEIILAANRKAAEIYGFGKKELVGMSLKKLTKDVSRGEQQIKQLLQKGTYKDYESRHLHKDGTPIEMLINSSVIEYKGEAAILSVNRDITDRKRVETELRMLSGRLLRLQDEERRRIARELHDTTAQNLVALVLNLGAVRTTASNLNRKERHALTESLALAEQCLREIRSLSYLLHPPELDEFGLVSALRQYVEGFKERSGIHIDTDLPAELDRLPQEAAIALFRVVQESLTNIQLHSRSRRGEVKARFDVNRITLNIRDEGQERAPSHTRVAKKAASGLGVGIASMRERLRQLGGTLEVSSSRRGTTVAATIPFSSDRR